MTVKKLKNLEMLVMPILKQQPQTRSDDFLLYAEVIRKYNPELLEISTKAFLFGHNVLEVPSYESISRVRRKIQAEHTELASERAKKKRAEQEAIYRQYATSKGIEG